MARRRMIDPNFWQSEDVAKLNIRQRLLFVGLFSNADDEGKLRGNPAFVRSLIFPYEDISISDIEDDLNIIEKVASLSQYEVEGNKYIKLINWTKFQRVDKPQKSMIPEPSKNDSKNGSENDSEDMESIEDSDSRLKERKGKERRIEEKGKEEKASITLSSDPTEKLKNEIHELTNTCNIKKLTLHDLDRLFSYIGLVDKEIIEASIKKSEGKHVNYALTILDDMYKEGIFKKEHLFQKSAPGKLNIKTDTLPTYENEKTIELTEEQEKARDESIKQKLIALGEWNEDEN